MYKTEKNKIMKDLLIIVICFLISSLVFSQTQQDQGYPADWALVEVNGLYGFIDNDGHEVVKPKYHVIGSFGEYQKDWALVEINGLYGFINDEGTVVVKPRYHAISKFGLHENNWALVEFKGYYGFIDDEGTEVVKPKYHDISVAVAQSQD